MRIEEREGGLGSKRGRDGWVVVTLAVVESEVNSCFTSRHSEEPPTGRVQDVALKRCMANLHGMFFSFAVEYRPNRKDKPHEQDVYHSEPDKHPPVKTDRGSHNCKR